MIDYLIGVDGGGTGTRVRVARTAGAGGGEVAHGAAGPCGLALGVGNAWNVIQAAVAAAFAQAGIAQPPLARIAIGLGLAGVHNKRWAAEFVAADPGYGALVLETDAYACLLGAHEGAPGAIVALGTGSVGKALYPDGRRLTVGGWGFPAADEAGGAWIGLRAVNHIQQVLDGRREPGAFADALIAHCGGCRDTLQAWLGQATETDYAALAQLVLKYATAHAGAQSPDSAARAILLDAGQEAGNIARALDPDGTLPLALCGGLAAALRDYLPQGLSSRAAAARGDAAAGALRLIARHLDIHPIEPRRRMHSIQGNILTPDGWIQGDIAFGDTITRIGGSAADPGANGDDYILPGFIDLHVHGGAGRDMMEGGDAPHTIARLHARHGTTSLLATTMTAPVEDIDRALQAIGSACKARGKGEARILGVHLEGPYINSGKLGAQPPFAREASMAEVDRFNEQAPMRLITVAPEIDGHLALVRQIADAGIRVQIGHTTGSYEDGVRALEHGAAGFTHLFNAMPGLHHREPGMTGAALAHAQYAEIIPDLLHVHPGAIQVALRCIPNLYCVTDSTAAAGMPDGEYMLGRQVVHKCMGGVRLADGTLAGSTLTMDQALRNLVSIGLDLADASRRVSTNAADYLGETRRGRLAPGCFADLVVLDRKLNLKTVYIEGEACEF